MASVRVGDPRTVRDRIQIGGVIEIRDDCKGCDQCVQYCPADPITIDGLGGRHKINHDLCVNCGQCLVHCPFSRIDEVSMVDYVKDALNDPNKHVVAQTAPSVRVALGEEFGSPAGANVEGKMFSAVRELGFDTAWDTNFAADMTITEEGFELVERIWNFIGVPGYENAGPLPQFTSCCPGWVRFFETRYPERLAHISSARSPVMMFGPVAKTYGAEKLGVDPANMFNVAISPCTAKKFEVTRPEFISSGYDDVDAVITTREFAELIRETVSTSTLWKTPRLTKSWVNKPARQLSSVTRAVLWKLLCVLLISPCRARSLRATPSTLTPFAVKILCVKHK